MPVNKDKMAAHLRHSAAAADLGLKYEALRMEMEANFPEAAGDEEYTDDAIDEAIKGFLWWWVWGN